MFCRLFGTKNQIAIVTLTGPGFDLETLNILFLFDGLLGHLFGVPSLHGVFLSYHPGSYSVQLVG
jgi:hypothetical protein